MRREELEHLIRAAAAISGEREIVIVGAAAILGAIPDAPPELRRTLEADLYPRRRPEPERRRQLELWVQRPDIGEG